MRKLHSNMLITGTMVRYIFPLFTAQGLPTVRQENVSMDTPFLCKRLFLKISDVLAHEHSCVMSLMATTALLFHCLALCVVIYTCVSGRKMLPLCICSIFISSLQFLSLLPTYFCKSSIVLQKWIEIGKWSRTKLLAVWWKAETSRRIKTDWPTTDLSNSQSLYHSKCCYSPNFRVKASRSPYFSWKVLSQIWESPPEYLVPFHGALCLCLQKAHHFPAHVFHA